MALVLHFVHCTNVSLLLRLSAGDRALKQPLLAIYQLVVCSLSYSGHVRGRRATSRKRKRHEDVCSRRNYRKCPKTPDKGHKKFRMSTQAG